MEEFTEEELMKGPNYWKDKDPAKYKKMLSKLKRDRKTPGHKERAQQQVLQAKRRERGGSGTTAGQNGKKGHSSGKMKGNHGTAVKRYQSSEKKAGQKLSPDRKDNNKGYGKGNVRNIPQNMNRGRHNADEKKVSEWRKKLKKFNIELDDFMTLLQVKALENGQEELYKTLKNIDIDLAIEELEKWKKVGGAQYPEETDEDGSSHPDHDWKVKATSKLGRPIVHYADHVKKEHEDNFVKHWSNFKNDNELYNSNEKFRGLFDQLVDHIKDDPDTHAIGSGTTHEWDDQHDHPLYKDKKLRSDYKEPRMRHLTEAMRHSSNIAYDNGDITFYSQRHSNKNPNDPPDTTKWRVRKGPEGKINIQSEHTRGRDGDTITGHLTDTANAQSKRIEGKARMKRNQRNRYGRR